MAARILQRCPTEVRVISTPVLIALVFLNLLLAPAYLVWVLWRGGERTLTLWCLKAGFCTGLLLFFVLAGRWDWLGIHLRLVWLALLGVAIVASARRARHLPWSGPERTSWLALGSSAIPLAFALGLLFLVARARVHEGAEVPLALPLHDGRYYVAQGGSSSLTNHHHSHRAQSYALDIVALDAFGLRARGLLPSELERYAIFGRPVHSPCDGVVARALDGRPDQIPPQADPTNPSGNHVLIACQGVRVLLAHLRKGSVEVANGDRVSTGHLLGAVGNSGNTSEPHLHIHAVRESEPDEGVPVSFDGTYAVRNTVFSR